MNWSALTGRWTGTNLLRLSWLSPSEFISDSQWNGSPVVQGHAICITYSWRHDGAPHAGLLLIVPGATADRLTGSWVDSWHQNSHVMPLEGYAPHDRHWILSGSYPAPPDPDWGWRIELVWTDAELTMTMYNLTPDGVADLAARAEYRKV